jgi:hypothetical protein
VSSSSVMRKKSRQICGRNTTVAPTPDSTPPTRRSARTPSPRIPAACSPIHAKPASIQSIGYVASLKIAQNSPVITAAKRMSPSTGCVKARSAWSVKVVPSAPCRPEKISAASSSAQYSRASCPARGPATGIRAPVSALRSASRPSPVRALHTITGHPRISASRFSSPRMPLRRAASTRLMATTVGRRRRSASPSTIRPLGRLVASSTTQTASGATTGSPGGARSPASTRRTTVDSLAGSSIE